ncbi:MAG TPA: alpha/beta hydrolase [Cellulomonas sp.]
MGVMAGPLWVEQTGSGRPLVLLHGNGETHRVFDRMVPLLAPQHRLVGLDSRGHGRSPRGDGPLTIARMADDVDEALDALGLDGVDLLGFSDGGNVALELALRHPGRSRALVVVGANLFPAGLKPASMAPIKAGHAALRLAERAVPWARTVTERWALMTDDPHIDPADLARVSIPALVVVGRRDVIRPEHTRLIAGSLPHARLATVEHAGHMLPVTHPRQLVRVVETFLASR